jgi:hypothetical protein
MNAALGARAIQSLDERLTFSGLRVGDIDGLALLGSGADEDVALPGGAP